MQLNAIIIDGRDRIDIGNSLNENINRAWTSLLYTTTIASFNDNKMLNPPLFAQFSKLGSALEIEPNRHSEKLSFRIQLS